MLCLLWALIKQKMHFILLINLWATPSFDKHFMFISTSSNGNSKIVLQFIYVKKMHIIVVCKNKVSKKKHNKSDENT